MKKHYKFEIDCANCAAKVEDAIKKIDGGSAFFFAFWKGSSSYPPFRDQAKRRLTAVTFRNAPAAAVLTGPGPPLPR